MAKRKTAAEKRREAEAKAKENELLEAEQKIEDKTDTEEVEEKSITDEQDKTEQKIEEKSEKTLDVKNPAFANKVINEAEDIDSLLENLSESIVSGDVLTLKRIIETYRIKRTDAFKKDRVNNNYSLYRLINSVLEEPVYELFVLRFKLLNKAFLLEKKDVLNSLFLSKYDYLWTWSIKTHKIYHMMVELISETCDPSKRKETLKVIDIENNSKDLSSVARQNLIRFYK